MNIPRVNFEKINRSDKEELTNLRLGVCEVGFIILEGTPIDESEVKDLVAIYRDFFHSDLEKKAKLDMALTNSNRGWGKSGSEQVNPDANPDYKEVFDVGVELKEDDKNREITYYAPNQWPEAEFRGAVLDYYSRALNVSLKLLRAIARVAELPEDFFDDKFDPPMALLRANYYPPRPKSAGANDFGIAAHTDYGCLTLLAVDGVAGLEVQMRDGSWQKVDARPGEFVINFGEMLESWSGGKIKATLHRVIGTNEERISIPFFCNPAYDTNVAPIGSGQTLLAGDYLSKRYDETYIHRQKAVM